MEALIMTLLILGVVYSMFKGGSTPATATVMAANTNHLELARTVTVVANTPADLGGAINRVRADFTGNTRHANYIVGAPHINPDGLSAHLPLFHEPN